MTPLTHLADRLATDPAFCGHWLREVYVHEDAARAALGCDGPTLSFVSICRVPRDEGGVEEIASKFGVKREALRRVAEAVGASENNFSISSPTTCLHANLLVY